jgi:chromosome segregation ATPase
VKASKESLSRNLKAEQESIPFIEAEVSAVASKLASLKEQIAQKSETRKRHERSLREILTRLAKAKKAFESFQAQLRKTQDEVNQIVQKISENNQALAQESTKIMAIMNEKKENEKKLVEYKQRQTIIESEINVILKIYRPSSI